MRTLKDSKFIIYIFIALLTGIISCAKIGQPEGGPKDEDPPVIKKTKPASYATNAFPKKISIEFDEFIILENERSEFVISPFFEEEIYPRINNKSVIVDLRKIELDSNQTYTINFGECIADNNERNKFPNYSFVFSTGDFIDSMSLSGNILDAFNLKPIEEGLNAFLYKNHHDSIPLTSTPDYIARVDKEGNFIFRNVAFGTYRLFALNDGNMNYMYDQPDEAIAFLDTLLTLEPFEAFVPVVQDTAKKDTGIDNNVVTIDTIDTKNKELVDSTETDSVLTVLNDYVVELRLFKKHTYKQKLSEYKFNNQQYISLKFDDELKEEDLNVKLLYPTYDSAWYLKEFYEKDKKANYWFIDTALAKSDSIVIQAAYPILDTNDNIVTKLDTLLFENKKKKEETKPKEEKPEKQRFRLRNREEADTVVKDTIIIPKTPLKHGIGKITEHDINKPVDVLGDIPFGNVSMERIQLYYMDDTIEVPRTFKIEYDSVDLKKFRILHEWEDFATYKVRIPEGTVTDIYGAINDTLEFSFTTQKADFYGALKLTLTGIQYPTVLQFMGEKEEVLDEFYVKSDKVILKEFIHPGKYFLKGFIDINDNKKWDTGDYYIKKQPETVFYYDGTIEIKSNWEMDISWELAQ